jgi:hypothetical protein
MLYRYIEDMVRDVRRKTLANVFFFVGSAVVRGCTS